MPRRPPPRQLPLTTDMVAPEAPPPRRKPRGDTFLVLAAVVGGAIFFSCLGRIWPLASTDLVVPKERLETRARSFLHSRGLSVEGFDSASRLVVDDAALDYAERTFGRARAQGWIGDGLPLVFYAVSFKKAGEPDGVSVSLDAAGRVLGWGKEVEEDEPGQRIGTERARSLVELELTGGLGLDPGAWTEKASSARELPNRSDHTFVYERDLSVEPELRERIVATVSGSAVTAATRRLVVPASARREAAARAGPPRAVESVGVMLLAVAAVGAFVVFLRRLRDGSAGLNRAALWVSVLVVAQIATQALQSARLFAAWETLLPRWVSTAETLFYGTTDLVWTWIVLLAFIAAGDSLDRESGAGRGASLWALGRGRLAEPSVAAASWRGFLVGLACGGVLAASVVALEALGARTAIQPRGFFFFALNSAAPSVSTLLFFLNVALAEELGYRFFGATFLLSLTRRRWVAVLVPAVVYGLTHTTLDFLPPAEPFWGRPVVMTLVGCVWGWAFLRYDALTVVLSHLTADLFIFNWPRLASGRPGPTAAALLVVVVPLLPAAVRVVQRALGRSGATSAPA